MKFISGLLLVLCACAPVICVADSNDMLTPAYYEEGVLRENVDTFLKQCRKESMHHPLKGPDGMIAEHRTPVMGEFGAGKGPTRKEQHHPAIDMHVGNRDTLVNVYSAHDGVVTTIRENPKRKYRHYVAVTKVIHDDSGKELGKLTTIYGHVDLDLDEAEGLLMTGRQVKAGDLISKHLYADTVGGPHLHFEIRYYRPGDNGTEEFYGFNQEVPGAGPWPWGKWDPNVGFGYGHPGNFLDERS